MSIVPKAFYGLLVFVMLASFAGSCVRISKMQRDGDWAYRYDREGYPYDCSWFESLTIGAVRFMGSTTGKITCFVLIVAASAGCGIMAFKNEYLYPGLFTLMACAAFIGWIFIKLRFIDPFTQF
jgi:hypothetical protein